MRIKTNKMEMEEVNMTPMIDIVFQLIAFFMVVINFAQTQADERVTLPKVDLALPPEVTRKSERVFNIGFDKSKTGKIQSGPWVFHDGKKLTVAEMAPYLNREARSLKRDEKLTNTTVVIRSDERVPHGVVQDFISLAQEYEFEKFALSGAQKIQQ